MDTPCPDARSARAPDILTVPAAAARLGCSIATISGWIGQGSLPAQRHDRRRWVRLADLLEAQRLVHAGGVVPAWRREPKRAGWRLRRLREAAALTQLELAARSGLTHETISRLEHGRRQPYARTLVVLAQALGTTPAAFVSPGAFGGSLTTAEAAARLAVPAPRLQEWLRQGKLTAWKASGQWRVDARSVAALAASDRLRGRSRRLDPRFHG
jgi:excisionase family DNA binding protein